MKIPAHLSRLAAVIGIGLVVAGCAPAPSASTSRPEGDPPGAPAAPKTLHLALQNFGEPKAGVVSYGAAGGFDTLENFFVFHSSMTVYDPAGNLVPRLVERVPTVQNGDWVTFPDGRMDVTWKLRDTRWHDGTPFTSADVVLGYQILIDPDVPVSKPGWSRFVASLDTPDPRTLVVHWKQPFFEAGGQGPGGINPAPEHLIGKSYREMDKQTFLNLPYWTDEFVGLGPYRLGQWVRGSHIDGTAFDGYVLGKPKIDKIVVHYAGDINTVVAGVLAGDLDVVPMGSRIDTNQLTAVKLAWGDQGGISMPIPFGVRTIWLQLRDPSLPWAKDVRVRRAMSHSADREGMAEALQNGLAPIAYTYIFPDEAAFKVLEQGGFSKYPYDPNRAHQLLAETGWTLGSDGRLRDQAGQPFAVELSATGQGSNVQEIETIGNIWQRVGFTTSIAPLPPTASDLDFRKNNVKGGFVWPGSGLSNNPSGLATQSIPSERTAWKGGNYSAYSNPAYDQLYDRFQVTLDTNERIKIGADIMRIIADEVPVIPLFYYGNGLVARNVMSGPGMISPLQTANAWNVHEWEKK